MCLCYTAVHPHVRGEYPHRGRQLSGHSGSSPRAWGIPAGRAYVLAWARFIPTCVGNTARKERKHGIRSVHPHVRGEYRLGTFPPYLFTGSSPRAWGIRGRALAIRRPCRFIPTCVGNTRKWCYKRRSGAVHPHVRGEYSSASATASWGPRFIPTCVGNTLPENMKSSQWLSSLQKSTDQVQPDPARSGPGKSRPSPPVPCGFSRSSQRKILTRCSYSRPSPHSLPVSHH